MLKILLLMLLTSNNTEFDLYSENLINYRSIFWSSGFLYLLMVYKLPQQLKNREPFNLKYPIFIWNSSIAIMSFYGAKYTLMRDCSSEWSPNTAFWVNIYIWSKIPEMIDTLLLILKKKKVIFLHVWHHFSVTIIMWHTGSYNPNDNLSIICMGLNYSVHTLMYGYYALSSINIKIPYPQIITGIQIIQFLIGLSVPLWENNYPYCISNHSSPYRLKNRFYAFMIAFSYLLLFGNYYISRYINKIKEKI